MSLWSVARTIAEHLILGEEWSVLEILRRYSPEQKRFIVAIKHQASSLLFYAVTNKLLLVVLYFLQDCAADPNSLGFIDGKKLTCLAAATVVDSQIIVNLLLDFHANIDIVFSPDQITVLYYACMKNRFTIVQLLLRRGANPNSRNSVGDTCLMACMENLSLFRLLVSAGADVNLTDRFGVTCLVMALERRFSQLTTFLLGHEDTQVRLIGDSGTDTLYHAVTFFEGHIIGKVIEKGSYTREEFAVVHEMHSCEYYVTGLQKRARESWQEALRLRGKPSETPMFDTPRVGILTEVINFFNAGDIPPLFFLDSMLGFSLYTVYIYTQAALNVNDVRLYINIFQFFFQEMNSMEDRRFFQLLIHADMLVGHFFILNVEKSEGLEIFDLLVNYIEQVNIRLDRMTSDERSVYGFKVDYLLLVIINSFDRIYWNFRENINFFYNSIKRLIDLDIRGPSQKSLLQKCVLDYQFLIEPFFLACHADVNSCDRFGKTILHDLIESEDASLDLITLIIDQGFDFQAVKYYEYCLVCKLAEIGLLPNPVKHMTLQCLAIKAFCRNAMTSFDDVPRHLMSAVKSHLHL